jgi:hypothetical protein
VVLQQLSLPSPAKLQVQQQHAQVACRELAFLAVLPPWTPFFLRFRQT